MLSALVPSLALAASTTYELAVRTEARGSPQDGSDLQLNPALSLKTSGNVSLAASYTPRILIFEPQSRRTVSLFHRGNLRGEWRFGRSNRVFLDQRVEYGDASFSWFVTAAEGVQPSFDRSTELPPLRYFSESTALGIGQALSKTVGLNATAAYTVTGGVGAEARTSLPLRRGPRLALSLAWAKGTHDALLANVTASEEHFSTGIHSYIVDSYADWRHKLSQRTQFDLALGAGWGRSDIDVLNRHFYPYAGAGLRRDPLTKRAHDIGGSLRLGLGPAIDPLTGSVYARAQGLASVDYFPIAKLDLAASAGGALGLSTPLSGQRLGFGGVSASYELNRHFTVTGGLRIVALPSVHWAGFVALAVVDRGRL